MASQSNIRSGITWERRERRIADRTVKYWEPVAAKAKAPRNRKAQRPKATPKAKRPKATPKAKRSKAANKAPAAPRAVFLVGQAPAPRKMAKRARRSNPDQGSLF